MGLIVDLTGCQFVSAQGYAAIGRCSLRTPVEVRSGTTLASRVFEIYGYDRVTTVTTPAPTLGKSSESADGVMWVTAQRAERESHLC
jgi:hypothetical protein